MLGLVMNFWQWLGDMTSIPGNAVITHVEKVRHAFSGACCDIPHPIYTQENVGHMYAVFAAKW